MTRRADLGPFEFESGESIPNLELSYETYGRFDGDNAVLVCHALTGSHHVRPPEAGDSHTDGPPSSHGWWGDVVGPDAPIDTTEQFVVCATVPGSCHGSSGPASSRPDGTRWGSDFPTVSVGDWTRAQRRLLDHLGIGHLDAVVGGSVGGMNALDWATRFPEFVDSVAAIATGARLDTECLALDTVARRAITTDPSWHGGDYHETDERPVEGLAQARRIGHIMYRSKESLDDQFGRESSGGRSPVATLDPTADDGTYHEVASYLDYNARRFAETFDPASYLRLLRAMDEFDLSAGAASDADALAEFDGDLLLVSYTGDWHFPVESSETVAEAAREAGVSVRHHTVDSDYGHDAFLAEQETLDTPLREFFEDSGERERRSADGHRRDDSPDRTRSAGCAVAPVHAGLYGR